MPLDLSAKRDLQFPLDKSLAPSANTPDEPINELVLDWPTTDNDEKVVVTLEVSLNEFVALASTIDVGSDIAYGDDAIFIWWLWVRSINSMAFCEQVTDCIDTDTATQTAINQTLLSSGHVNPDTIQPLQNEMDNRLPPTERAEEIYPPPAGCNNDMLWAGIVEIVTRLDAMGLDFLEGIVADADKAERIANIIDIVPLFGDIAADVITLLADNAQDLENAYVAHSSVTVIEDVSCALFEMVCEECRYPTFEEVWQYYADYGIVGIQDIASLSVTAIVDYLIGTNGLANLVVWYTTQSVVLFTLFLGGTFAGKRGKKWLGIWADIGEDAPSNGWELLCDGCQPETCVEYDFTIQDWDFVVWTISSRPFGTYVAGVGWECTWDKVGIDWDNRLYIERINMINTFDATRYEVDYVADEGGVQHKGYIRGTIDAANGDFIILIPDYIVDSAPHTQLGNISQSGLNGVRFQTVTDTSSANPQAYTLKAIRIYYSSVLPPDGGNPC